MPQLKVENLYNTTITEAGGIPSSGDCDFSVANPPENTNGFIIISPENPLLREIMYYHDVVGNRIYVRGENRMSPKAHAVTESVKMNDVAEIFNTFSDMISQAFYVEKTGGLSVKVWGGYVYYNGTAVSVADMSVTLVDNTINYITYTYATNTIESNTTNTGNIKVVVTTSAGLITSIAYKNPKESYIDFTVALTGALPDQSGQGGKSLITNGATASWQSPFPSQAGNAGMVLFTDGTNTFWGAIPKASTTVAGSVEIATQAESDADIDVGGTGATLVAPPSVVNSLNTIKYIAGEALTRNDFITYEEQTAFANIAFSNLTTNIVIGDATARTRQSIRVIGNGVSISTIKLSLLKTGTPTDNITVRIETDSGGLPSGTLVNANATATVAGTGLTTSQVDTTITFAGSFTRTAGVPYHIVVSRSGSVDPSNYYRIGGITKNTRGFSQSIHNGTSWAVGANTIFLYTSDLGSYNLLCVKTNASFADSVDFIGVCANTVAIGATATILQKEIINNFSGLSSTSNTLYFLSNTPGAISTTAGTEYCPVGTNISTTSLYMNLLVKLNRKKNIVVSTSNSNIISSSVRIKNTVLSITLTNTAGSGTAIYATSPDNNTWTTVYSSAAITGYSFQVLSGSLFHRVQVIGDTTGTVYAYIIY